MVSPQQPEDSPEEQWPAEAAQHWDQPVSDALVAKLNRPDVQAEADDPPPLVGPPLYGGHHAAAADGSSPAEPRRGSAS